MTCVSTRNTYGCKVKTRTGSLAVGGSVSVTTSVGDKDGAMGSEGRCR